ncbi:MAG: zinc ribbon domain-containing protein [Chloroflexota bacterium]
MPIYEYRCAKCGREFELMRKLSEMDEPASCPQCGSPGKRLVSAFASKVGFYIKSPDKSPFRKPS